MENPDNKSTGSLEKISYVLMIALTGGLFLGQDPFHESRPDQMQSNSLSSSGIQDVDARLWQDPFEAVHRHKSCETVMQDNKGTSLVIKNSPGKADCHDNSNSSTNKTIDDSKNSKNFDSLQSIINTFKTSNKDRHFVEMAVMLPGGPYYEDSETRRRLRYAVLSGFNAAVDYQPVDSEHIGFFEINGIQLVYEYLAEPNQTNPEAIILYLNSDDFEPKPDEPFQNSPDKSFNALMWVLNPLIDLCKTVSEHCHFNLLGPTDSEQLRDWAKDIKDIHDSNSSRVPIPYKDAPIPYKIRIYSPIANVDGNRIMENQLIENKPDPLPELFKQYDQNIEFTRISASHDELAKALLKELELRNAKIVSDSAQLKNPVSNRGHVILITDKESFYGWNIGKSYLEQIDDLPKQCGVRFFSYFRGLDGEKPRKTPIGGLDTEHFEGVSGQSLEAREAQRKNMEQADGDSQFDYIRRLSSKLEELDNCLKQNNESENDGEIAAIGILGSDVYDKLLVLEALHEKFQHVLFFTNGMDARLLHPEQNKWARNLLVVSGFGLELEDGLQKDIPPFRDSIQTSYFLATETALWDSFNNTEFSKTSNDFPKQPNIFEIGRTKAFYFPPSATGHQDLPRNLPRDLAKDSPLKIQSPYLNKGNPPIYQTLPPTPRLYAYFAICSFILVMAWKFFRQLVFLNTVNDKKNSHPDKLKLVKLQQNITLSLMSLGVLIFFAVIVFLACHPNHRLEEPFAWLEGVSIWPTELVRCMAIIVAINGIVDTWFWPNTFKEHLHNKIGFDFQMNELEKPHGKLDFILRIMGIKNLSHTWKEIINIVIKFLLLFGFAFLVILGIGTLNIPARGSDALAVNKWIMTGLFFLFIVLMVMTTGRVQTIIKYIEDLSKQDDKKQWDIQPRLHFKEKLNIPADHLHEWISIRLIGELTVESNRLLLYPMIVLALHVLSRISYFDNWITPPGLFIALSISFAYLFYCDFRLKTVAEEAENIAMKNLRRRLIRSYRSQDKHLSQQLEKLIEGSKSFAEMAYKPFIQRPFFQGMMLVIIAAAIDYSDYSTLVMKLFK